MKHQQGCSQQWMGCNRPWEGMDRWCCRSGAGSSVMHAEQQQQQQPTPPATLKRGGGAPAGHQHMHAGNVSKGAASRCTADVTTCALIPCYADMHGSCAESMCWEACCADNIICGSSKGMGTARAGFNAAGCMQAQSGMTSGAAALWRAARVLTIVAVLLYIVTNTPLAGVVAGTWQQTIPERLYIAYAAISDIFVST